LKALVVFLNDNSHPLSFLLKKGFRHCFVCINKNGLWIRVDNAKGIPDIEYLCGEDFNLIEYYRGLGYTVVETSQREKAITCPVIARDCVGMVKSILCISNFALTPYALYRSL